MDTTMKPALLSILVTIALLQVSCDNRESSDMDQDTSANSTSAIDPPLSMDVPAVVLEIDPTRDTTVAFASGSFVRFKAGSIVDQSGEPVNGMARISFREFKDAADIMISGIPMIYQGKPFESAAMCEVIGLDGVKLAKGTTFEIGLASSKPDDDFLLYRLDRSNGEWAEIGTDRVMQPNSIAQRLQEGLARATAGREPQKPLAPVAYDPADECLVSTAVVIENLDEFPELTDYDDPMFRVASANDYDRSNDYYRWYAVHIDRKKENGAYSVTMKGTDPTSIHMVKHYEVEPVLKGRDYSEAMAKYEDGMIDYQGVQESVQALAYELDELRDEQFLLKMAPAESKTLKVLRYFEAEQFGVYNCDRLFRPDAKGTQAVLTYLGEDGKPIELYRLYAIDKSRNWVAEQSCKGSEQCDLFLFQDLSLELLGVTMDGKLATASFEDLKRAAFSTEQRSFVHFHITEANEETIAELKQELEGNSSG